MTKTPIRDLDSLLVDMSPALDPNIYVFVTSTQPIAAVADAALLSFREAEGMTYVVQRELADSLGLTHAFANRRITLRVTSALEAVGFLAAITRALATHGIAANVVSAFHHDHLFVPPERADEAMRVLERLSADSARRVLNG